MLFQKPWWLKPGLLLFLVLFLISQKAGFSQGAQIEEHIDEKSARTWSIRLIADGMNVSLPDTLRSVNKLPDPNDDPAMYNKHYRAIPELLGKQGYLSAVIDSVSHNMDRKRITMYAIRGCRFRVASFTAIVGSEQGFSTDSIALEDFENTKRRILRNGDFWNAENAERDIREIIRYWEELGYLFVSVTPTAKINTDVCETSVELQVELNERVVAKEQLFPGIERNQPEFLKRISGVQSGMVITPVVLRNARLNLENTGLFQSVNEITVVKEGDDFKLLYDLEERRTNSFDLLFGYVPEPTSGSNFIGSGDLIIRNIFFQGSRLDVSFERLQQFVTRLDMGYESVYIGSTPFGAGVRFSFEQQDTLYQIRNIRLNGRYRLSSNTSIIGSLRQETSNSGTVPAAQQLVFNASSFFTGLGLEYRDTDRLQNPTRGFTFRFLAETGYKRLNDPAAELLTDRNRWNQQELEVRARAYINPFARQVISPSVSGFLMISPEYTESELNRFGGAKSLRGYREEQFRSSRMLWGDTEYRYLLDRLSYAFVFGALGYYERPELIFERKTGIGVQSDLLYSYGLGFSYATPLGIMQFTYALSAEDDFTNGKIHIGITANL